MCLQGFGFDFVSDGKPSAPEVTRSSRKGLAVRKSMGMRVKAGSRARGCCRKTGRRGLDGGVRGAGRWSQWDSTVDVSSDMRGQGWPPPCLFSLGVYHRLQLVI